MELLTKLEKQSKLTFAAIGFALIGVLGILDFVTGYELAFSLFYLFPIFLLTWLISRRMGIVASFFSAFVWLLADVAAGNIYSSPLIYFWNTLVRLAFFIINTLLLSGLRQAIEHERELAHTDYLTGAINSRYFYAIVQMEIDRFQRYKRPFTLAYLDLDDFKRVNDRFGHSTGDQVLRVVAHTIRNYLRKSDVVARLGGDEFAVLLLETDQEYARLVITKIQDVLLEEMSRNNWSITFSIGVLFCPEGHRSVDDLVRMADDLMYAVKRDGKNAIKFSICVDLPKL
jgi:diguanylate cyclase (GGDEF)-like protein